MLRRMRLDHPLSPFQEVLDLACVAKNSMGTHHGASPYQLMCGSTPRVPKALIDDLPALSQRRVPADDALHQTLSALSTSRLAHTQAEADQPLRRALARYATNVPPPAWARGDVVYYWTEGTGIGVGSSQGPAHVTDVAVAKDAVRLQHGNAWLNRNSSEIRRVPSRELPVSDDPPSSPTSFAPAAPLSLTPGRAAAETLWPTIPPPPSPPLSRTAASRAMVDGAVAALNRAGAPRPPRSAPPPPPPPPPLPPPRTPWTGRTRERSDQHVRFLVADCPSSGIAALAMTDTEDFALRK